MKTTLYVFVFFLFSQVAQAQQNDFCGLQKLLSINSQLSEKAVEDSINKTGTFQKVSFNNTNPQKTLLVYTAKNIDCFNGHVTLKFEFTNDKLVNAQAETEFARTDQYELMDQVNKLRSFLKQNWEKEKEAKSSSTDLISNGYNYSKPKNQLLTSDKISLQYINTKQGKGYGVYLLRLSWLGSNAANLEQILY